MVHALLPLLIGLASADVVDCPVPVMAKTSEAAIVELQKRRTAYSKSKSLGPAQKKACLAQLDQALAFRKERLKFIKNLKTLPFREILRKSLCFNSKNPVVSTCPPSNHLLKNGDDVTFGKISFARVGQKKDDVTDPESGCKFSLETDWTPTGIRDQKFSKCAGMTGDDEKDFMQGVDWKDGMLVYHKGDQHCEYEPDPESEKCGN